jgi:hypothetical protein
MTPLSDRSAQAGRARLIIRILVTTVTGGVTYLVSAVVRQPPAQSLMLAVFVGGVVLVVQLLAEFDGRVVAMERGQERLIAEVRDLLADKFSAVGEATELFGRVEVSALREDVIRLAHSSLRIGRPAPPLIVELARAQIDRVTHLLDQVGSGSVATYDGEDRDWLLALAFHVKSTLDAISRGSAGPDGRFVDEGLWRTELGQRYLELQVRALGDGVRIRRVFILERPELADDPLFRDIYEEQEDLGIEVQAVDLPRIRIAGINFVSDFVLFDDVVSYELAISVPKARPATPMYVGTSLFLDPVRIGERRQRFDALWQQSSKLPRHPQIDSTRSATALAQPQERLTPPPP